MPLIEFAACCFYRCLHNCYHGMCSVMTSEVSKEKKECLLLSSIVEVDLVDSFLSLVLVSTK